VLIFLKSGSLNFLEPSRPVQACNGIFIVIEFRRLGEWLFDDAVSVLFPIPFSFGL
jgi:hypothetical protein